MAKKNNSRKAFAAALAVVGIAGLSIASASQLDITVTDDNIATGNQAVVAACDDAVNVAFTTAWNSTTKVHDITAIVISDIAAGCAQSGIEVRLFDNTVDNDQIGATHTGTVTGTTYTVNQTIAGANGVGDISITIS